MKTEILIFLDGGGGGACGSSGGNDDDHVLRDLTFHSVSPTLPLLVSVARERNGIYYFRLKLYALLDQLDASEIKAIFFKIRASF